MPSARFINPDCELEFAPTGVRPPNRPLRELSGLSVEHVQLPDEQFEYKVAASSHYLALHDIELQDGEIELADGTRSPRRSLADRLTFVPAGCEVTGWSMPKIRRNSFTALYFDATTLVEEFRTGFTASSPPPFLYAVDRSLQMTLEKLAGAITVGSGAAYLESLCLVAVGELLQIRAVPSGQRLSEAQLDRLLEFVEAHLEDDLSVEDLAKVLGLSRFHFSRIFKTTTSRSPYQFLLERRVRRAMDLLRSSNLSVADIARQCGFRSVPQFEEAFRRAMGTRPIRYRAELE
ncbi:MAG: AraC family transcriptional regulator [Alphaproteobacteria bacterium]|nr:AraC family transcriptional regulator [Alphaproteobacteria bacterium]MBU0793237.1 AraC family transcriptional regulator [Alphaproteobacteria bacterium]MBU0874590.1 AraC family transcriptional regulator [Alphaproteobacteria bacterium]MBU1769807.1 AraC family transcriptional regulator [Alphaproteobacteria bacterium]